MRTSRKKFLKLLLLRVICSMGPGAVVYLLSLFNMISFFKPGPWGFLNFSQVVAKPNLLLLDRLEIFLLLTVSGFYWKPLTNVFFRFWSSSSDCTWKLSTSLIVSVFGSLPHRFNVSYKVLQSVLKHFLDKLGQQLDLMRNEQLNHSVGLVCFAFHMTWNVAAKLVPTGPRACRLNTVWPAALIMQNSSKHWPRLLFGDKLLWLKQFLVINYTKSFITRNTATKSFFSPCMWEKNISNFIEPSGSSDTWIITVIRRCDLRCCKAEHQTCPHTVYTVIPWGQF